MSARYEVREGSQTAHCCFEFTVVDTTRPRSYRGHCHVMCECFDREEADTICSALNKMEVLHAHDLAAAS